MFSFIKKLFGNPAQPDLRTHKVPVIEPIQPIINTPPQVKTKTTVRVKKETAPKEKAAKITTTKKEPAKKAPAKPKKK